MAESTDSSCENPRFPSWMWRYNRNKRLSRFEPWLTRVERWPPRYRNMGVPDNFRFHPVGPNEEPRPFLQLGANYAHDLANERATGFGNGALGNTPGPAPPRLVLYEVQNPYPREELYKVNEIHDISAGMSLMDYTYLPPVGSDASKLPLNPRQYLELTLNQSQSFPGTFPHYNVPIPSVGVKSMRVCGAKEGRDMKDPLQVWMERKKRQEQFHALERMQNPRLYVPPLFLPPCKSEARMFTPHDDVGPHCPCKQSKNRRPGIIA